MKTVFTVSLVACAASLACAADAPILKADHKEDVEQQLIKVERAWNEAFKDHDKAVLSALCSDDFVYTDEDGKVVDRRRYIGTATTEVKVDSYKLTNLAARSYGDTGLVTGRWAGTVEVDGHGSEIVLSFTDTFVHRDNRWWAVASHSSKVAEDGTAR
jgi:ketosteroid isomerase-like protein